MTKQLITLSLCLFTAMAAWAQNEDIQGPPPERLKEIKAQKVAFITQYLHLSPDEAKVFWPVYDKYEQQLRDVRKDMGKDRRQAADGLESITDAQAEAMLTNELANKDRENAIEKERLMKIKEAVGAKKALFLGRAEREFTRQLFRNVRRGDDRPRGRGR
ncbi:MAG: hypothetical protein KBH07_13880 [Flavobacteriales bacterium]|nr:hypothetical protein [Flavobacteriales bacterium]